MELHGLNYPFKTIPAMKIAKLAVDVTFTQKYKGIGTLMIQAAEHIAFGLNSDYCAARKSHSSFVGCNIKSCSGKKDAWQGFSAKIYYERWVLFPVPLEDLMLRQVMIPSKENSTISIPAEFYGTEVEVLVFPSYRRQASQNNDTVNDIFDKHLYSFENYRFDRDEANDYE